MHFQFSIPSSIAFGEGNAQGVGHIVLGLELTKVFCLYDAGVKKAGLAGQVVTTLKAAGLEVVEWDGVTEGAPDVAVEAGAELARQAGSEVVVAVGGGSVIDTGKAISILLTNESPIALYEGFNMVKTPSAPLVAIPTTAGSGSEVNSFAVITDTAKSRKILIGGQYIGARYTLVDPLFTVTMPQAVTAITGMDAMGHAVEAYLSQAASVPTDINAIKAVELISRNIVPAFEDGKNLEARINMQLGSILAAFAANSAALGLAHSIAHPLSVHCAVSDGMAAAALLPHVVNFNAETVAGRVRDIGNAMGLELKETTDAEAVKETVSALKKLCGKVGIPALKEAGVSRDLFEQVAKEALQEVSTIFNPRSATGHDIIDILEQAF